LRVPARDELMLWHYKHLCFERNAAREAAQGRRLGPTDVASGLGQQYLWSRQRLRRFWDEMEAESTTLQGPGWTPDLVCATPLWWRGRSDILSASSVLTPQSATTPTVSVLIKTFNHYAYVRQTIESVLTQSFQDFEIVVTDDGSTDGTPELLREFTDPRIHIETFARNEGISTAMNATIARARGRYLAILNSDDWALPDRLQRQVAFLEAHPNVSLVFGLPRPVDEAGNPAEAFNDFTIPLRFPDFSRRSWLRHFFFHGNCLCAPTAMIRREAYAAAGPYDARLTSLQDFDMWVRMLVAGYEIWLMSEQVTAFRVRDGNANLSAPRPDTMLRSLFETGRILRWFNALDTHDFDTIFGVDLADTSDPEAPTHVRLAQLALRTPRVEYQSFALELLYETARTRDDFERLRLLSGHIDPLRVQAMASQQKLLEDLAQTNNRLEDSCTVLRRELDDLKQYSDALDEASRCHRQEMAGTKKQLSALRERLDAVENSTSWRMTQPMRMVAQYLPKAMRARLAGRPLFDIVRDGAGSD
jgi:glycosyltransferase involved in cell wall biosynthesis